MLTAYWAQLNLNSGERFPIIAPLLELKGGKDKAISPAPIICKISSKIFWSCSIRLQATAYMYLFCPSADFTNAKTLGQP